MVRGPLPAACGKIRQMKGLLAVLVSLAFSTVVSASSEWNGLWRITTFYEDEFNALYHLAISGEEIRVFDEMGRKLEVPEATASAETLDLLIAPATKPHPFRLTGARQGDQVTGEWTFFVGQYSATGKLKAERVFEQAPWDPFEAIRADWKDGLIDLTGFLLKEAPRSQFDEFVSFWNRQVLPRYYFLVQGWLYGEGDGLDSQEQQLRQVFEFLGKVRKEKAPVSLGKTLKKSLQEVKARFGSTRFNYYLVNSIGPEGASWVTLSSRPPRPDELDIGCCSEFKVPNFEEQYLILNPLALTTDLSLLGVMVKQELILHSLWPDQESSPELQLFKRGLSLHLALELEERAFPSSLQEVRKGYDFAQGLLSRHSLEDLLKMDEQQITSEWQSRRAEGQ